MRARVAALALGAAALGACGSPPADLFEVRRTGRDPNANLTLVVSDGGTVRCGSHEPTGLDADRLLRARQLARDLAEPAALGLELPPGRGTILAYRARLETGTIAFADSSPDRPAAFDRLAAFTADVAENVCRVER